MAHTNNRRLCIIICLIFTIVQLISSFECDNHSSEDDISFDTKVSESPIVILGTSLNKNMEKNIRNLFNVTFLVQCVLKGRPTQRIIYIVQAGSLLGRRACQRLDANRQYIVFLEPFFDGTYRPADFEEILYTSQVDALLDKTCGLTRTYPFTEANDTGAAFTNKCPAGVSVDCVSATTKKSAMLPTNNPVIPLKTTAGSASTAKSTHTNMLGKNPMDLAVLSLLLDEHQPQDFNLDSLSGQSHKSLFSDDKIRKNTADRLSSMLIVPVVHWIFFIIFYIIIL